MTPLEASGPPPPDESPAELDGALEQATDAVVMGDLVIAWNSVLLTLSNRAAAQIDDWVQAMANLVREQALLVAEGRWRCGPSDLMQVLNLARREVANCRVLRWLLDPLAHHGLAVELLRALAAELSVTIEDPSTYRSYVEVPIEGTRADIVLKGTQAGAVIVVEAKVDAGEQHRQAARLERCWPKADIFVYLTTDGKRLPRTLQDPAKWRPLSWKWVVETTNRVMQMQQQPPETDDRVRDAREAVAAWLTSARSNLT